MTTPADGSPIGSCDYRALFALCLHIVRRSIQIVLTLAGLSDLFGGLLLSGQQLLDSLGVACHRWCCRGPESESKERKKKRKVKIKLSLAAAAATTDGVEEPFAPKSRVDLPLDGQSVEGGGRNTRLLTVNTYVPTVYAIKYVN